MPYRLQTQLNQHTALEVVTDSLADMVQALSFFKLISPEQAASTPSQDTNAPEPEKAEAGGKGKRAVKINKANAEVTPGATSDAPAASTPVSEPPPAAPPASSPTTAGASEGNAPAPSPAPAPSAPAPAASSTPPAPASAPAAAESSSEVTPELAADAVRQYGQKNGIVAARELMARHKIARTADITPQIAPLIYAEATL